MKCISFFIIAVPLILSGCSVVETDMKPEELVIEIDNQFPSSAIETINYLRGIESKTWKVTAFTFAEIMGYQQCRMDDVVTLSADKTYTYDGGFVLCGAEDTEKNKSGTWELDDRLILFNRGEADEFTMYIESLSETEVVVSASYYGMAVVGKFEVQ